MYKNVDGTNYVEGVHYDLIRLSSGKLTKVGFENKRNLGGRVDMHIHSTSSDGTLNPDEIIRLALMSNVSYGSIKRFERKGEISLHSLTKLCVALDIEDEMLDLFTKPRFVTIDDAIRYEKAK